MKASDFALYMSVEVYEAYELDENRQRVRPGPLVIVQELPSLAGECEARIIIPMAQARRLAEAILAYADGSPRDRDDQWYIARAK
jgi:hypothetical protein